MQQLVPERIALTIQQPWAELILRGIKTIEVRRIPVAMRTTIYLYTSKVISRDQSVRTLCKQQGVSLDTLPRGCIVGTVDIADCRSACRSDAPAACVPWKQLQGCFSWEFENPQKFEPALSTPHVPYGVWFYPFKEKANKSAT